MIVVSGGAAVTVMWRYILSDALLCVIVFDVVFWQS